MGKLGKIHREPSLHIREDILKKSLSGILDPSLVEELVYKLRKFSCTERSVIVSNKRAKKKLDKLSQSNKASADLVSAIIYNTRLKLKHRGVKKITEKDQDWLKMKEIASTCSLFCETFDLPIREGCIKYIRMVFDKLTSYRGYLNKLISFYDGICEEYQSLQEINRGGNNIRGSREVHDLYVSKVLDVVGLKTDYTNKPNEFIHFLNAAKICDELGCDYNVYIDAQFEELEWARSIPSPSQLDNEKSHERLANYLASHNLRLYSKEDKQMEEDRKGFWKSLGKFK